MALLPSTDFTTQATGAVMTQFNWASRPITIYKEPVQAIVGSVQNLLYGYNVESQTTNSEITLSSESQIFSGLIIYPFKNKNSQSEYFDNKIQMNPNKIYAKVTNLAKDYILNGAKTEKLECDSQTFNVNGRFQVQNFMGLQFFYFELDGTN